MPPKSTNSIRLQGVRQNNLKGFDLAIPVGKLTVVTGLSGAGKSSLVFETLHAEGQRRYVETFSPYTRQFLDLLDRPKVDSVDNIRPSIAIQQSNTVKTSRSTVGTITELCDYFKVWFANEATLHDPATGKPICDDNPQSVWKKLLADHRDQTRIVAFEVAKPGKLDWSEILQSLSAQGYTRIAADNRVLRIPDLLQDPSPLSSLKPQPSQIFVLQDRVKITPKQRSRTIEGLQQAFHFGKGRIHLLDTDGTPLESYNEGLSSPVTGETFRPAIPALFSFNSPIGACPECRGFGRIIEIDDRLVIPDESLSIDEGAIRAFQGDVYSESLRDLQRAAKRHGVRTGVPFAELSDDERAFVFEGEAGYEDHRRRWYGIRRFFKWLEGNLYKMHVRVFLSKFRSYKRCPSCHGARLQPESLNWKWQGHTLPDLYQKSVSQLLQILRERGGPQPPSPPSSQAKAKSKEAFEAKPPQPSALSSQPSQTSQPSHSHSHLHSHSPPSPALHGILTRLGFLDQVGLGYLTLDRSSRTLSGGETMRVNLTSCLGSALTDTLFVLDEPSVGLHARDMDRLIGILRRLTDLGNTVVVVEHDDAVMRAADHLVEIGPEPGANGGQLTFSGSYAQILRSRSLTGRYLAGRERLDPPEHRRPVPGAPSSRSAPTEPSTLRPPSSVLDTHPTLSLYRATKHNLQDLTLHIPLQRFVCLSGVSGSGKSTLLDNVIYQNLLAQKGQVADDPAALEDIESSLPVSEILLVDQSPVSKTPRSNPAVFSKAWDEIRKRFAKLETARAAGMGPGHFSFNSGDGRCPACSGLGYERVEMQFVSDLFVPCESCEGQRFKPEVLRIVDNGKTVADILDLDVAEAVLFFDDDPKIARCLQPLVDVGLGYLKLGQPLNTLSGGESQRLKLVRHLGRAVARPGSERERKKNASKRSEDHAVATKGGGGLILIDEPTTGLHRHDVKRLIRVLQSLVDAGHSLIVIEHNLDLLKSADWLIELGPEAGVGGGRVIAEGPPEHIAETDCQTAPYLREALGEHPTSNTERSTPNRTEPAAAEDPAPYGSTHSTFDVRSSMFDVQRTLTIVGAREHNLRDITTKIPRHALTVVTGVSGSGKSSLAFDILFAEGQRRFMESMSAYARQFVEQMPRAEVDELHGLTPTVAIEQRVTKGTRKSTVATITEVAQYLRLLYARIGVQHSPATGEPVVTQSEAALQKRLRKLLADYESSHDSTFEVGRSTRSRPAPAGFGVLHLCAPLIRGRKGHHQPLADWARDHGYDLLRIDGELVPIENFKKLDRYREHDIELVIAKLSPIRPGVAECSRALSEALKLGKGTAFLLTPGGETLAWLSTRRTDPVTGEAFPELDPKHFSWNSPRGWCPTCRGYGQLFDWMAEEDASRVDHLDEYENGDTCPDCAGTRLNPLSRSVRLPLKSKRAKPASTPNSPPVPPSGIGGDSAKLRSEASRRGGPASVSLPELLQLTPARLLDVLDAVKTTRRTQPVLDELRPEIEERLRFMDRVGLGYLGLDRATATLSGGEAQRIRLAAQLGSNLSGVLYVLDEPSIGLHARDNARLIDSLEQLRDRGNTLVVVEHDTGTMRHADKIIDLGPGAGIHGGEIVAQGTLPQLRKNKKSLTGRYLRKDMPHPLRGHYRELPPPWSPRKKIGMSEWIALRGATLRNLKGFDLALPKNRLTVVCGPSGAGKSTLVRDLLRPLVETAIDLKQCKLTPEKTPLLSKEGCPEGGVVFRDLHNAHGIRKVIEVDQSPIGKTPRSTPATYIGAFDIIRDIYASLPEANMRGHTAGTFSFNTKGGRCETCKGAGRVKLEMNFMPDTYVTCEDCGGRRYGAELDELKWHGKSIADVLQLSFEEAAGFFSFHTRLGNLMQLMVETGLGYITLGQYSPTLSGGEAQRLKLVSELAKGLPTLKERQYAKGQGNLYLLEEPTIGLHTSDVERLLELLHRLVDRGHTVVVVEHHLDLIADADYVVEIGPDGGEAGGRLLYQGDVAGLRASKKSVTAKFLK